MPGIVYGDVSLKEAVAERSDWAAKTDAPLEQFGKNATQVERLYWSLIMASEWAREKAKLISSSPGAITGELLLFFATVDGRVVASSWGLCGHAGALRLMVNTMADNGYDTDPAQGIEDGDIFTCNDPVYGASQNNDVYTAVPVFHEKKLIGWATGSLHIVDAGSVVTPMFGGLSPTTFTDGMIVPPMRSGRNFEQSKSWELMLKRRTRTGVLNVLDDKMKLVGALLIRKRVLQLIEEYGPEFFMGATSELIERDRREIRELARSWSVPSVSHNPRLFFVRQKKVLEHAFPDAAHDYAMHVPVTCRYDVDGTVTHDYSGASSQQPTAWNCHAGGLNLATYVDFPMLSMAPSVSAGIFDVVKRVAEPGTMMNPTRTDLGTVNGTVAAIDNGSAASHSYALTRFSRGFLEQAWCNEVLWNIITYQGEFKNRTPYASADWSLTSTEAIGVASWRDGIPVMVGCGNPQPDIGEAEEHELLGPTMVYIARALQPEVMCHGKFRGPLAVNLAFMIHNPGGKGVVNVDGAPSGMSPICMTGLCGGYPALPFYIMHLHETNAKELISEGIALPRDVRKAKEMLDQGVLTANVVRDTYTDYPAGWQVLDGDLLFTVNEAASSWGDPIEREPRRVQDDVRGGWISREIAQAIYGVVVEGEDSKCEVADSETSKARADIKHRRRERAVPFRDWWETERKRVIDGDVPVDIATMYEDCVENSDQFWRTFGECWGSDAVLRMSPHDGGGDTFDPEAHGRRIGEAVSGGNR